MTSLLALTEDIARRAGAFALEQRKGGVSVAATKSTDVDIVTQVDRDTETLIRKMIATARPDDGVLGEEDGVQVGTSGLTWVVDPIDGTVNFLYGIPGWAVSVAVVEGDGDPRTSKVLAGAVFNPTIDEMFTAAPGEGAFLNGVALNVTTNVPLDRALVGTGFGYGAERRVRQSALVSELIGHVRDIRRMGAASLDLCAVAAGRLDAYFEQGLNPWDHAAGELIAREAGALVQGLDGGPATIDMLIAAEPSLFTQLEPFVHNVGI